MEEWTDRKGKTNMSPLVNGKHKYMCQVLQQDETENLRMFNLLSEKEGSYKITMITNDLPQYALGQVINIVN